MANLLRLFANPSASERFSNSLRVLRRRVFCQGLNRVELGAILGNVRDPLPKFGPLDESRRYGCAVVRLLNNSRHCAFSTMVVANHEVVKEESQPRIDAALWFGPVRPQPRYVV